MNDLMLVLLMAGFFLSGIGLVEFCHRLGRRA